MGALSTIGRNGLFFNDEEVRTADRECGDGLKPDKRLLDSMRDD